MPFTSRAVLNALYLAAFNRLPDPSGLAFYGERLRSNENELEAIASEIYHSEEHHRLHDHSQFGELGILLRYLIRNGSRYGIIVDVGARGRDRSNSYDLLNLFGWKGLLIEANPSLHDQIRREFAGLDFQLETCAVSASEGTMPFFIGANDDVSSLKRELAASWGDLRGSIEVQVRRLHSILQQHGVPLNFDILSLDIEGLDVEVFNDLIDNSDYRPRLVVIEASFGFATKQLSDVNASQLVCESYRMIDATEANLILEFIDERRL